MTVDAQFLTVRVTVDAQFLTVTRRPLGKKDLEIGMRSDTEYDFVFATIASIAGLAVGIGCIVVGTSHWDLSWKMLPIAAFILFLSIRVLSDYPKELLVRFRGEINERQEVIVELIMWLVVITISVCIRMLP